LHDLARQNQAPGFVNLTIKKGAVSARQICAGDAMDASPFSKESKLER
jgi:hypothetical protein